MLADDAEHVVEHVVENDDSDADTSEADVDGKRTTTPPDNILPDQNPPRTITLPDKNPDHYFADNIPPRTTSPQWK